MEVQSVGNINFGAKNTYLQKSKHSATKLEQKYFKSLHFEALSRMHYLKYQKLDEQLVNVGDLSSTKEVWNALKLFGAMLKQKVKSALYAGDAYGELPDRFIEADNKYVYPHRHYQLKSFSGSMPTQIKKY